MWRVLRPQVPTAVTYLPPFKIFGTEISHQSFPWCQSKAGLLSLKTAIRLVILRQKKKLDSRPPIRLVRDRYKWSLAMEVIVYIPDVLIPRLNCGFLLFVTPTSRVHDRWNQHGRTHMTRSGCLHRGTPTLGALVTEVAGSYYKCFSVPLPFTLQQPLNNPSVSLSWPVYN